MKKIAAVLFILSGLFLNSCKNVPSDSSRQPKQSMTISGAGATFPYPFYNIVFRHYMQRNRGLTINYGAIGSGGGIRSLRDCSVDFGASDAFLSEKEIASMPGEVIHIPTCMGGIVMAYRLSGVKNFRLTGPLISDIFMGKITTWNDSRLKAINPGVNLPDLAITPVYRSDGSGTTYNFSDYLCAVSPQWKATMGKGKALKWNAGIAAKGNPGVAGIVQQTEGAIGYIGSEYALTLKLPVALLQNKAGNFVEARLETISAAANVELPGDMRASIIDSDDPDAYPISLFTWVLVYKNQEYGGRSAEKAGRLAALLLYIISAEGQAVASQLNYAPLPEQALEKTRRLIGQITYKNKAVSPYVSRSIAPDSLQAAPRAGNR